MFDVFSPPGRVRDLGPELREAWSVLIERWLSSKVEELGDGEGTVAFFSEKGRPVPDDAAEAAIDWDAFPLTLRIKYDTQRAREESERLIDVAGSRGYPGLYELVDGTTRRLDLAHRNQDEYCEWVATLDPATGRLEKITFTCEGPEYWQFIADGTRGLAGADLGTAVEGDRELLVDLYRRYVSPAVTIEDLLFAHDVVTPVDGGLGLVFPRGSYNPYNRWNTTDGIMHLTHPANSLRAEINLAGDATVLRSDVHGNPVTGASQLICCSGYGTPNRSSDPTIGASVNALVRQGLSVTLRDPIGLYIKSISDGAFEGPGGEDGSAYWNVVRGEPGVILRVELRVPDGADYGLEDVLVAGEPLRSGAQVAEHIRMTLYGKAHDFGDLSPRARPCIAHCCTSQANLNVLQIVGGEQSCSTLNQPGRSWKDSFPELVEVPEVPVLDTEVVDLAPLPPPTLRRPPSP